MSTTDRPELFEASETLARLSGALSVGGVGIWAWNLTTDLIATDPVARRLWGLPEDGRLPAARLLDAIHPDDAPAVRSAIAAARSGDGWQADVRLRRPDGEVRWMRLRGSAGLTAGEPEVVGVTIDVTDDKRAEGASGAAGRRLQRAQELGGAAFDWDARTDHLTASAGLKALCGLDPEEPFDFARFLGIVHPNDRMRVEDHHYRLLESPGPYESDYRIVLPDGRVRWVLSRGETICDEAGHPTGIAGVVLDITSRKEVENDLRRSRRETRVRFRELKALYQNAPVGLALLDRKLRFVRINAFLSEIYGLSEAVGCHVFDVVPDFRGHLEPVLAEVLETGRPIRDVEIEGATRRRPDERLFWRTHFYPLTNENGSVLGIGVVAEDVTAARRAEQARDLLGRELSHRIKNLFAVLSSLIRLSAQGDPKVQPFAHAVRGRIEALGRAHDYVRPYERAPGFAQGEKRLQELLKTVSHPTARVRAANASRSGAAIPRSVLPVRRRLRWRSTSSRPTR